MAAHELPEVTVVADAGMMSEANLKQIEDAGLRFIVGARIPDVPYQVKKWRQDHPDEPIADGQIFVQPTVMGPKTDQRHRTIIYQYREGRAKRTLKGIDTQIAKAEKAIKGQAAVKRNRFVQLTGGTKTINRDLEAKTRALAGLKGYITNLQAPTPDYVLGAYHQLWKIEKSFRMSKSDLRARPIYHHKRESIEAHLTIVMAALAISHWLERTTDTSIKKIVQTLRRHRSIAVQTGDHILHAGTPLDDDARAIVSASKPPLLRTNLSQVRSEPDPPAPGPGPTRILTSMLVAATLVRATVATVVKCRLIPALCSARRSSVQTLGLRVSAEAVTYLSKQTTTGRRVAGPARWAATPRAAPVAAPRCWSHENRIMVVELVAAGVPRNPLLVDPRALVHEVVPLAVVSDVVGAPTASGVRARRVE